MNSYHHTLHEPKLLIEIESFTKRIIDRGLNRKDLPELVRLLDAFEQIYSCNHVYTDYLGLFEFLASYEFYGFKHMQDGQYTYASLLEIRDESIQHFSISACSFRYINPKYLVIFVSINLALREDW